MARPASPLTEAIRSLCEESNGSITHSEARPKLVKMGFEVAEEPKNQMSDECEKFMEEYKKYQKPKTKEEFKAITVEIGETLKLGATFNKVMKEFLVHKHFRSERNNFDVTKSQWKGKQNGETDTSKKPKSSVSPRAKTAAKVSRKAVETVSVKPKPKHRPGATTVAGDDFAAETEALRYVEENGGYAAVEAKMEALTAEIEDLKVKLELVERLKNRLNKSAA